MVECEATMRDIERRYQLASGLTSRDYYSIFYGPLSRSKLLMINANPGGDPSSYSIVDVYKGQNEYVEGRNSGPTTRNGAEILREIAGSDQGVRGIQVLNRYFRRSPGRGSGEKTYMAEARPFLAELIRFIQPAAILFGGDAGVRLFTDAHGGRLKAGEAMMGPNGRSEAVYYREYELTLPYYRSVPAYGIYHPSKLNGVFRKEVMPLLKARLSPLFA